MNIISPELKNLYKTFINELLRTNSLSLPCRLIYEGSLFNECINCNIDPISHKSSNTYKNGGPLLFSDGQICPYCRGLGGVYSEAYDTVDFMVLFDYKYWINFNSKVHSPEGLVQTISKFSDFQKIKKANRIIIDTSIQDYTESYFQRNSEPEPCGFGESSYLFTYWKKI
jgi:hypothetical protein